MKYLVRVAVAAIYNEGVTCSREVPDHLETPASVIDYMSKELFDGMLLDSCVLIEVFADGMTFTSDLIRL